MFGVILFCIAVYLASRIYKIAKVERPDDSDDGKWWRRGKDPSPKPFPPNSPGGYDFVPEDWVLDEEYRETRARMLKPVPMPK